MWSTARILPRLLLQRRSVARRGSYWRPDLVNARRRAGATGRVERGERLRVDSQGTVGADLKARSPESTPGRALAAQTSNIKQYPGHINPSPRCKAPQSCGRYRSFWSPLACLGHDPTKKMRCASTGAERRGGGPCLQLTGARGEETIFQPLKSPLPMWCMR
jgi:hypothetical protein